MTDGSQFKNKASVVTSEKGRKKPYQQLRVITVYYPSYLPYYSMDGYRQESTCKRIPLNQLLEEEFQQQEEVYSAYALSPINEMALNGQ